MCETVITFLFSLECINTLPESPVSEKPVRNRNLRININAQHNTQLCTVKPSQMV